MKSLIFSFYAQLVLVSSSPYWERTWVCDCWIESGTLQRTKHFLGTKIEKISTHHVTLKYDLNRSHRYLYKITVKFYDEFDFSFDVEKPL